jgi:hypothetical protein
MVVPVYRSSSVPDATTQSPALKVIPLRSRARMSLRVEQPFRSTSNHAGPNFAREYPVMEAAAFVSRWRVSASPSSPRQATLWSPDWQLIRDS